jgi:hypothetical protein
VVEEINAGPGISETINTHMEVNRSDQKLTCVISKSERDPTALAISITSHRKAE